MNYRDLINIIEQAEVSVPEKKLSFIERHAELKAKEQKEVLSKPFEESFGKKGIHKQVIDSKELTELKYQDYEKDGNTKKIITKVVTGDIPSKKVILKSDGTTWFVDRKKVVKEENNKEGSRYFHIQLEVEVTRFLLKEETFEKYRNYFNRIGKSMGLTVPIE